MTGIEAALWAAPAGAFLAGALPFSYLIARAFAGIDIREHGSGNPGASNVYRVVGPLPGALCFVLDTAKGSFAVWLALLLRHELTPDTQLWYQILLGFFAVLGHVFSPFLNWRGGKGVATFLGVFLVLFPLGVLAAFACGVAVILIYRYFSLGSLVGAAMLPAAYFLFVDAPFAPRNLPLLYLCLAAAILTFLRHLDNIKRLWLGSEHGLRKG